MPSTRQGATRPQEEPKNEGAGTAPAQDSPAPDPSAPDAAGHQAPAVQMATEAPGGARLDEGGGLASLEARVRRLENLTGHVLTNATEGRTQEEIDDEVLSRFPNSHAEAVAYDAAQKRREQRAGKGNED